MPNQVSCDAYFSATSASAARVLVGCGVMSVSSTSHMTSLLSPPRTGSGQTKTGLSTQSDCVARRLVGARSVEAPDRRLLAHRRRSWSSNAAWRSARRRRSRCTRLCRNPRGPPRRKRMQAAAERQRDPAPSVSILQPRNNCARHPPPHGNVRARLRNQQQRGRAAVGQVLRIDTAAPRPRLFRSVLFFPEDAHERISPAPRPSRSTCERSEGRFIQSVKGWLPSAQLHGDADPRQAVQARGSGGAAAAPHPRGGGGAPRARPLDEVTLGRPAVFSPDAEADALAEQRLLRAAELAGLSAHPLSHRADRRRARLRGDADARRAGAGGRLRRRHVRPHAHAARPEPRAARAIAAPTWWPRAACPSAAIASTPRSCATSCCRTSAHGSTYEIEGKRMPMPMAHPRASCCRGTRCRSSASARRSELIDRMLLHQRQRAGDRGALRSGRGEPRLSAVPRHRGAKIRLSSAEATRIEFDEARIHIDEPITRAEFERFSAPLLDGLRRVHRRSCSRGRRSRPTPSSRSS